MFCPDMSKLKGLYRTAATLALVTIFYNIAEGVISVWFGSADGAISLLGFGLDSFVEVISGVGIWHMVRRLAGGDPADRDPFERQALRITGSAFYLLAVGLLATALISFYQGHRPETTRWGIIVGVISIVAMQMLIYCKVKVGAALDSPAILADAACSRACLWLSVILLAASCGYALTGIGSLDAIGSLFIAALAVREGREAMHKAKGLGFCACSANCGAASGAIVGEGKAKK